MGASLFFTMLQSIQQKYMYTQHRRRGFDEWFGSVVTDRAQVVSHKVAPANRTATVCFEPDTVLYAYKPNA